MESSSGEIEKLHYKLSARIWPFKGWGHSLPILFPKCKHGPVFHRPAPSRALKTAEATIGMPIPDDLKSFYRFSNGLSYYGRDLVYRLDQLVDINLLSRKIDINMPVDHLLFFGGTGDGDEYAFGRRVDGNYHRHVFVWRHETDERAQYAGNLQDYLLTWAVDFKMQPHLKRV